MEACCADDRAKELGRNRTHAATFPSLAIRAGRGPESSRTPGKPVTSRIPATHASPRVWLDMSHRRRSLR